MGIGDKISGRVKQAAGDLLGSESLHREGKQEERKGDAKEEQARAEARAEQAEQTAEERQEAAERRAEAAAEREFEKADREAEQEQARVEAEQAKAERKAEEVADLEAKTDPDELAARKSKDELYDDAQDLGVRGRADMSKEELADEVSRRS
jgi:ribonuclease E